MIQKLVEQPERFEFFHAVRLIERYLKSKGVDPAAAVRKHVQFSNSTSLGFAGPEVEQVELDGSGEQVRITPSFIGLLGVHGTLPQHYTEAVQGSPSSEMTQERQAFLDALSSRLVGLFYEAWKAQRFELARDDSTASLRPRLLALAASPSGSAQSAAVSRLETYFCGLLRQQPVSAVVLERVLARYFDMPVEVTPGIPVSHPVPEAFQTRLGASVLSEDSPCILGSHMRRRDMRCTISLRPASRERAREFVRDGPGAAALEEVLRLFAVSTVDFEVCVVVPKEQVQGIRLDGSFALGFDTYLLSEPETRDRDDMRYLISIM